MIDRLAQALTLAAGVLLAASAAAAQDLSPADRADIARVEAYLADLDTLRARFRQFSTAGSFAEGDLYIDRPGRMRMNYDDPVPLEIVATGTFLVYHDADLRQVDQVPMVTTPLDDLIGETPTLTDDLSVTEIERVADRALRVTLTRAGAPEDGSLTLSFSESPLQLRRWDIVDPEGTRVSVTLLETETGIALDPSLFRFLDPYVLPDDRD